MYDKVIQNNFMPLITFRSDNSFKNTVEALAQRKGINVSAYVKMLLTEGMRKDLSETTENGMTVGQELAVLRDDLEEKCCGPFSSTSALMKSLKK